MHNLDDYKKLILYRNKIIESYYTIYKDYKVLNPFNLKEEKDMTLDFVNCTICAAKDNIINDKTDNNYVMCQPCLRNNHIDILKDNYQKTNYMGYFTMLGGYHYIKEKENWINVFNKIVLKQFDFFRTLYPNNNIRLTISEQYNEFLPLSNITKEKLLKNNCQILYSKTDEKNLKWKYGIDNVEGYGTRWEILNFEGKYVNCGNDIILFKNNKAIGVDFGSGLETLVSVLISKDHLLYSNVICSDLIKKFCADNIYNEKFIDCLTSLLCIENYSNYYSFRIKYLKYMYIKIIGSICVINNISLDLLSKYINDLCQNLNIKNEKNNLIISEIDKQIKFLHKLSFLKNIKKLFEMYDTDLKFIYKLRGYQKNISSIDIEAIKTIRRKEKNNEKTKQIKKRR